ncbi:hypothetical protein H2O64_16615 [Kordia sp. YSTF-M3]|uniref:ADP-heptose:LPS heptosyltransferase n=1 Tax=Kordia aestuariivivens TaxID=2759037 RepID=A0ABR7QCK2_9FLAO|nr:hypothetical protein [Kordia aestuariivivens]MBC8756299.1 hypothetical protein [Kordia aestuariivivens]
MNKTLFVFSNDFGELVLLRLLLFKQPVHVYLALPERLFEHVEYPNATKFLYHTSDDLKKNIGDIQPEQVLLFSAYLIAPNNILTFPEFYSFLDYLDEKKIAVSTSDPFMRYYDQLDYDPDSVDFRSKVRDKLKELSERLTVYRHLYSVPVQFDGAPCQSFSNPFKRDVIVPSDDRKQWTFIMSSEEFLLLQNGNDGSYHKTLIPLFTSLVQNHNIKVNLVFPEALNEILKLKLTAIPNINYVSYCSMAAFEDLIAQSDLMLYWNVFSASTLLCRLYKKPTVFLGLGHMETIFPGFYKYIKSSWFPENDPEIIPLDDASIATLIKSLECDDESMKNPKLHQPYYELDTPLAILSNKTEAL